MSDNFMLEGISELIYRGICKLIGYEKKDFYDNNKLIRFLDFELVPFVSCETIKVCIGETFGSKKIYLDFKENPHSYICGCTGSGKSVCLKSLLTTLICIYDDIELYLCDLKMVELSIFRNVKQCRKFVYTTSETDSIILELLNETNFRYSIFMKENVVDIYEYNNLKKINKMKFKFLVIEEIGLLDKNSMKLLKKLISISRSVGIYIIVTTQRPCNDTIDNVVKSNISNRISFKVQDSKNSIIAIDQEGAEKLRLKGNGLIKTSTELIEFQGFYIDTERIKKIIQDF